MRSSQVDRYIFHAPPPARPLLERIRELIHAADAGIIEEIKWGAPCFLKAGLVCSMQAFKSYVGVWFHKGALLADPRGLLSPGARAHTMKVLKLSPTDQLDEEAFIALVREAVQLNEQGVRVPKPPVVVELPEELSAALAENPQAQAFFASLAPSHQREFAQYLAEAKRTETRARRLEKVMEQLAAGKTLHDKYRR